MTTAFPTYSTSKAAALEDLRFDPVAHRYTLGQFVVPGVTSIIDPLTGIGRLPKEQLEKARVRGTAVHRVTEEWDKGYADGDHVIEAAEDLGVVEYLEAWRKFVADTGIQFTHIEARVFHHGLMYAGTLDRIGTWRDSPGYHLFDIKSGEDEKEYGLQTAAYKEAWNEELESDNRFAISRRYVVQLKPNGKYALHEHRDKLDWAAFKAALTIYRWRNR